MITFNWEAIHRLCHEDSEKLYNIFKSVLSNKPSKLAIKYFNIEPKDSFLVNPKELIKNEYGVSKYEIYHYIRLASKRNLGDYRMQGRVTLPVAMSDISVNNFTILKQDKNLINFKYEE